MYISGIEFTYDEWHHVALQRDGTAYTLFVDGEEAGFSEDTRYGAVNLYQSIINLLYNIVIWYASFHISNINFSKST